MSSETRRSSSNLSRRAAISGVGAAAATAGWSHLNRAIAQDATPAAMAGHPLVGTWIVVRDITATAEAPSIAVYTADCAVLDPSLGVAGTWEATGPRSGAWTLVALIDQGAGGYIAVRSAGTVDDGGDTLAPTYSFTVVNPDGTVVTSGTGESTYTRLRVEPIEAGGTPLPGMPTWIPAPPEAGGTPTT